MIENKCLVGNGVSIQTGVYIPTNSRVGDGVFLGPWVVLTNDKYMGRGALTLRGPIIEPGARVGANATILPGVRIGEDSLVGAGAVVTRNVPPRTVVFGVPARRVGRVPLKHLRQ